MHRRWRVQNQFISNSAVDALSKVLHHSQSHDAPVARKGKQKDPEPVGQTTQEGDKERRAYRNVTIICGYNVTDTGMGGRAHTLW